jgi:hypothetical protein
MPTSTATIRTTRSTLRVQRRTTLNWQQYCQSTPPLQALQAKMLQLQPNTTNVLSRRYPTLQSHVKWSSSTTATYYYRPYRLTTNTYYRPYKPAINQLWQYGMNRTSVHSKYTYTSQVASPSFQFIPLNNNVEYGHDSKRLSCIYPGRYT